MSLVLLSFLICRGRTGSKKSAAFCRAAGHRAPGGKVLVSLFDARFFYYVPMLLFDLFCASPSWLGAGEALAALSSCKKSCSSCVPMLQKRGVQVAVLLLFEARRSRLDVQVLCPCLQGSQGSQPCVLSACLQHTDLEEQWGSGKTSAGRGLRMSMLP